MKPFKKENSLKDCLMLRREVAAGAIAVHEGKYG